MHRQTNSARLIHDAAFDVLPYPPGRVCGETKTAFGIEFIQSVHHPHIAFLDEIQQSDTVIRIVLGDTHHEPQVALDHSLSGIEVVLPDATGEFRFFLSAQQSMMTDFLEIDLGEVGLQEIIERLISYGWPR